MTLLIRSIITRLPLQTLLPIPPIIHNKFITIYLLQSIANCTKYNALKAQYSNTISIEFSHRIQIDCNNIHIPSTVEHINIFLLTSYTPHHYASRRLLFCCPSPYLAMVINDNLPLLLGLLMALQLAKNNKGRKSTSTISWLNRQLCSWRRG